MQPKGSNGMESLSGLLTQGTAESRESIVGCHLNLEVHITKSREKLEEVAKTTERIERRLSPRMNPTRFLLCETV